MSDKRSPLEQTQIPPKMPAVVRLELPAALELQKLLAQLVARAASSPTPAQESALEKFEQRIREAESRDERARPRAVGIFAEVLAACICPIGLPPLEDCPVHGGGAS